MFRNKHSPEEIVKTYSSNSRRRRERMVQGEKFEIITGCLNEKDQFTDSRIRIVNMRKSAKN